MSAGCGPVCAQISGIKLYRQEESSSPDEILMECDFMWSGQQVRQRASLNM